MKTTNEKSGYSGKAWDKPKRKDEAIVEKESWWDRFLNKFRRKRENNYWAINENHTIKATYSARIRGQEILVHILARDGKHLIHELKIIKRGLQER